jgi:chromosome partitioning protein
MRYKSFIRSKKEMTHMKIVAVTNRKGGVGKSTMTVHIAAGLAASGWQVGIVDTDSQGHAGMMLGMPEENGLYNVLINKQPLSDTVRLVPPEQYALPDHPSTGQLFLLPSSDKTYRIPMELGQDEQFLFYETLEQMGEDNRLDVIFIDTNPSLSLFDGAVYLAADGYIYVTECERMSVDGLQSAIEQMAKFQKQRRRFMQRDSRVLGIIPNKMRPKTMVHRQNISQIAEAFGPELVWTPVSLRTAWVEAANIQMPVYLIAPTGQEAREAWRLVEKTAEALRQWSTTDVSS